MISRHYKRTHWPKKKKKKTRRVVLMFFVVSNNPHDDEEGLVCLALGVLQGWNHTVNIT